MVSRFKHILLNEFNIRMCDWIILNAIGRSPGVCYFIFNKIWGGLSRIHGMNRSKRINLADFFY